MVGKQEPQGVVPMGFCHLPLQATHYRAWVSWQSIGPSLSLFLLIAVLSHISDDKRI